MMVGTVATWLVIVALISVAWDYRAVLKRWLAFPPESLKGP